MHLRCRPCLQAWGPRSHPDALHDNSAMMPMEAGEDAGQAPIATESSGSISGRDPLRSTPDSSPCGRPAGAALPSMFAKALLEGTHKPRLQEGTVGSTFDHPFLWESSSGGPGQIPAGALSGAPISQILRVLLSAPSVIRGAGERSPLAGAPGLKALIYLSSGFLQVLGTPVFGWQITPWPTH